MKTEISRKIRATLSSFLLLGAGLGLISCADEYAAYPGYGHAYYASYPGYRPYYSGYGYGYAPYRYYGPYYGSPYYGGTAVVVSRNRTYGTYNHRNAYRYRQTRANTTRRSNVTRRVPKTQPAQYDNDDERRYYAPRSPQQ